MDRALVRNLTDGRALVCYVLTLYVGLLCALDLSLVARLGGHSAPRTHPGKERFPGLTIAYALFQIVEKIAERSDEARIITISRLARLHTSGTDAYVGCDCEQGGVRIQEYGPVILATGGFGAGFTQQSVLAQYSPDSTHLPATFGEHWLRHRAALLHQCMFTASMVHATVHLHLV